MTAYASRLVVYAPNGGRLGLLSQTDDWNASFAYNDDGSITLDIPTTAKGYDLVAQVCELAVEININDVWSEVPGGRFLRLATSNDELDPNKRMSFTCPSYGWLLRKARVLPSAYDTADGFRKFTNATAGVILQTLFQEAQARGAMAGVTYTFTNTNDSAGQPWNKQISIQYARGLEYSSLLLNLAAQGMVDFVWQGRELRVYNADTTLSVDRTTQNPPVEIRYGRDVVQAPDSTTYEDLASFVYVQGDETANVSLNNPSAPTPWGRWENYISQGGVNDPGTLTVLAQADLEVAAAEKAQITRDLTLKKAKFFPFIDYFPGNYIRAMRDHTMQRYRVRQITLRRRQGSTEANVVLNDRFAEAEIRIARKVDGIIGGATVTGGSGATPAPVTPGKDTTIPNPPSGLVLATDAYVGPDGKTLGQMTISWDAPTQNTDGTALDDLAGYKVAIARQGASWEGAKIADADATVMYYSGLVPGATYFVRMAAFDQSNHYSTLVGDQIVIAEDTTPPPVPSTPTLDSTTFYGYIRVMWDGLGSIGEDMSPDWMATEVHASDINNFTPDTTTKVDEFTTRLGGISGFAASTEAPTYVRFVSVDASGNRSDPSAQASATAEKIFDTDILDEAITNAKIATDAIDARAIAVNAVATENIIDAAIVTAKIANAAIGTAQIADAAIVTAKIGDAQISNAKIADLAVNNAKINDMSVSKLTVGTLSVDMTVSARIKTANSGPRSEMDSSGFHLFSSTAEVFTAAIVAGTPTVNIVGTFQTGLSGPHLTIASSSGSSGFFGHSGTEIDFYSDVAGEIGPGSIYGGTGLFGDMLAVQSPQTTGTYGANQASILLFPGQGSGAATSGIIWMIGQVNVIQGLVMSSGAALATSAAGLFLGGTVAGGGNIISNVVIQSATIQLPTISQPTIGSGGQWTGGPTLGGSVTLTGFPTVSSGTANMLLGASGVINKISPSFRAWKKNIRPLDTEMDRLRKLLDLPVRFDYKKTMVDDAHLKSHWGLIIEDLQEAGLSELVALDENGEAADVAYDRVGVAVLPVVRQHDARLDDVERRLKELETA